MRYEDYLRTDHWQSVRQAALRRQKHCVLCRSVVNLQVHHNTYDRIWHEDQDDVVVLCETCHAGYHEPEAVPDSDTDFWPVVRMDDDKLYRGPCQELVV